MDGDNRIVLVLGATGQQGGSVADALVAAGWRVRALVRDPRSARVRALSAGGVETVPGDPGDPASVRAAMAGVYGVFSSVDLDSTILRPSTFMELLLSPDFGVAEGQPTFFMRRDQATQFIAIADIGRIAATVFAERDAHRGQTIQIAGDSVTGDDLAARISDAAGRPVTHRRFPDAALRENGMIRRLTELVDEAPLAGTADIDALRERYPGLLTFDAWLGAEGRGWLPRAAAGEAGAG